MNLEDGMGHIIQYARVYKCAREAPLSRGEQFLIEMAFTRHSRSAPMPG